MRHRDRFVTVYVATSQPEAYIIKGKLESAEIPVLLRYESAGLVYGIIVDGLGKVEVQVPQSLAETASSLLEEQPQADSIPPDQESDQ